MTNDELNDVILSIMKTLRHSFVCAVDDIPTDDIEKTIHHSGIHSFELLVILHHTVFLIFIHLYCY